jgi:hypothetical protein
MALAQGNRNTRGPRPYDVKKVKSRWEGMKLKDKLYSISRFIRTSDRQSRIRRNTVHYLMALYYQGYQNIEITPGTATFNVYEKEDYYIENQFRRHVDSVVNMLTKTEGELVIRPASDQPQDLAKAKTAGPVLDMQKSAIAYDRMREMKNLYKCLFGTAFCFTDYIRDAKYGSIVQPKFEYQEIPDEMGGDPFIAKVPVGQTKINRGSEIGAVTSPLETHVVSDVKHFTDVPYLQWVTRQDVEVLNYMYKGLDAAGGQMSLDEDMAKQYLEVLANLPGNILGDTIAYDRTSQRQKIEYVRTWIQPCMFGGDKELEREFPEGVHVATVASDVVDFYPENLLDRWTHEVLIPLPHSILGDGLYDCMLTQDQINETNSLYIQHVRYSTVGIKIYNKNIVDKKDIVNDPKFSWIPGNPSIDQNIQQVVHQLNPSPLGPEVSQWIESRKAAMQDMSSAYDPAVGKAVGANTPYSQSVFLTERAQSRWSGSNNYNRPELIRFHKNLLQIAQNEWLETRTQAAVANTGAWSFQQFSQADLCGEIDLSFSNTDMQPKSRAEQIQALQMLAEMVPLMPMLSRKQKLRVTEILGLPPDTDPVNVQISRAFRQIDRITKGEIVTPLPLVDDPNVQIPVIGEYLAGEDGEELATEDPQAFANVYAYQTSLMMMLQGMQGFAMPEGMGQQQQPPQPGQQPEKPKGQPGGQPGQAPGGPQAQTPAGNAPPVSPPSPPQ